MPGTVGRPMKYKRLLQALEDDKPYTPVCIALNGEEKGLVKVPKDKDTLMEQRRKIRHTMARYKANHNFPENGDEIIKVYGQSPTPAWYGRRWKERIDNDQNG